MKLSAGEDEKDSVKGEEAVLVETTFTTVLKGMVSGEFGTGLLERALKK